MLETTVALRFVVVVVRCNTLKTGEEIRAGSLSCRNKRVILKLQGKNIITTGILPRKAKK